MVEMTCTNSHMLKMMSYLKKLEKLKALFFADMVDDIILGWLPTSYKDFNMHLHMHEKAPILDEIHQSLKQVEVNMNKKKSGRNILVVS